MRNKAIICGLYSLIFCLITGTLAYANTGTGAGSPTYYYRDNRLTATGSGTDNYGYGWVDIIGKGGTQIASTSLPYNLDCNADGNIASTSRGPTLLNYYDYSPDTNPSLYSYQYRIYKNGFIVHYRWSSPAEISANQDIPSSSYEYTIYPYWDDLVMGTDSWVGFRMDGTEPYRRLIITYYHMYHTMLAYLEGEEEERSVTFQVIIYESPNGVTSFTQGNDIVFNYLDAKFEYWEAGTKLELTSISRGASATIGIELDGTRYLKYSYNTALVNTGTSILFTRTNYGVNVEIPSATESLVSAATPVKRGSHQAYLKFAMKTTSGTTQWTSMKVDKRGTALDADVDSVDVYKDANGDGVWNIGDTLLGSGTFSSGTTIIGTNDTINTTAKYYFIVVRLKTDISGGRTIGVRVRYRTYMQFSTAGSAGVISDRNF
ncbi:MAG: hypothetical protein WC980_03330 [Candidatus Brocadiia bacterium]